MPNYPKIQRLWNRLEKTAEGCWEWLGPVSKGGYGKIRFNNKDWVTHRLAYTTIYGDIPDGLDIHHVCRNRRCCNPDHLQAISRREHLLLGDTFQARNSQKTHCPQDHPYTGDNLYIQPNGARVCRMCKRVKALERYHQTKTCK